MLAVVQLGIFRKKKAEGLFMPTGGRLDFRALGPGGFKTWWL
jgi:hypothetical protein